MRIFVAKICRSTVMRQSYDICASVANLSLLNSGEFTMHKFRDTCMNVIRQSCNILEKTGQKLATIWRENKTKRH